jgi:hypothetical protein
MSQLRIYSLFYDCSGSKNSVSAYCFACFWHESGEVNRGRKFMMGQRQPSIRELLLAVDVTY